MDGKENPVVCVGVASGFEETGNRGAAAGDGAWPVVSQLGFSGETLNLNTDGAKVVAAVVLAEDTFAVIEGRDCGTVGCGGAVELGVLKLNMGFGGGGDETLNADDGATVKASVLSSEMGALSLETTAP